LTPPFTVRVTDLLNAAYEVLLQVLARYFNHTDESDAQLATLASVAFVLMEDVVGALGGIVTRLPIGPEIPGATAGPPLSSSTTPTGCCPTVTPRGR
jgi:hypothetical protein